MKVCEDPWEAPGCHETTRAFTLADAFDTDTALGGLW